MKPSASSKTLNSLKLSTHNDTVATAASKDCVYCIADSNKTATIEEFSEFMVDRERLYNEQPYVMFKYHITMCLVIFLAIASVLFITDLNK
jgi:hypothetical protein